MNKIVSRVVLSAIAVTFLSCDRPEKASGNHVPLPETTSSDADSDDEKFGKIDINIADERYLKDVKDLVTGVPAQLAAQIVSPKILAKITSKSWSSSNFYAVLGEIKSGKEIRLLQNSISCHFVDFRRDYAKQKSATSFNIFEYERQPRSQRVVLHLQNDDDHSSKFISCDVPQGQILTGFDLQRAFGNLLGLIIYIK